MLSFASDYTTGAHPDVLKRIIETNNEALSGYGTDEYCSSAIKKIKNICGREDLDIYFLVGGTQTNQIVIDTMLKPYEGIIAAKTGHVSVHEAGAIEYTGHKVLELNSIDGKINPEDLEDYLNVFWSDENHDHMVFPGGVYISFPTEFGTVYSKDELSSIYKICQKYNIPLYIDGARLGYGLASAGNDISIIDLTHLCDVFYIGGTKVGALCGEAVVFTNNNTPKHFTTLIKQHGALLAKGRLLGVQFDALFTDGLYLEISKHVVDMAMKLKSILIEKGYRLYIDSPTNQQFVIVDNNKLKDLSKHVQYSFWEKYDENFTVIRLATGWSTTLEDIYAIEQLL